MNLHLGLGLTLPAPAGAFDPATLAAWWRGDGPFTIATGIASWFDRSGKGRPQLQVTGAKQPILDPTGGPNGRPCVTADGINDTMRAVFTLNQPAVIYLVAKYTNAFAANEDLFDGATGVGSRGRFYRTAANTMNLENSTNINGTVSTSTAWHMYRIDLNGASSAVYQDGTLKFSGNAGVGVPGGLNLFTYADGASDPAAASIADLLVFSAVPSAALDASVVAYIRDLYPSLP